MNKLVALLFLFLGFVFSGCSRGFASTETEPGAASAVENEQTLLTLRQFLEVAKDPQKQGTNAECVRGAYAMFALTTSDTNPTPTLRISQPLPTREGADLHSFYVFLERFANCSEKLQTAGWVSYAQWGQLRNPDDQDFYLAFTNDEFMAMGHFTLRAELLSDRPRKSFLPVSHDETMLRGTEIRRTLTDVLRREGEKMGADLLARWWLPYKDANFLPPAPNTSMQAWKEGPSPQQPTKCDPQKRQGLPLYQMIPWYWRDDVEHQTSDGRRRPVLYFDEYKDKTDRTGRRPDRDDYEVTLQRGADGRAFMAQNGQARHVRCNGSDTDEIGKMKYRNCPLYVVTADRRWLVYEPFQAPKAIRELPMSVHHSSLSLGAAVLAAGHLRTDERGFFKEIDNDAGHYRIPCDEARQTLAELIGPSAQSVFHCGDVINTIPNSLNGVDMENP